MMCPECGKEMQKGFLQAERALAFNKNMHNSNLKPKDAEDVMIAKSIFAWHDFQGFICKAFGLITFDYKNANKY